MHSNGAGGDIFRHGLLLAVPIISIVFWLVLDLSSPSFIMITMIGDRILETSLWCSWGLTNGSSCQSDGGAGWNNCRGIRFVAGVSSNEIRNGIGFYRRGSSNRKEGVAVIKLSLQYIQVCIGMSASRISLSLTINVVLKKSWV